MSSLTKSFEARSVIAIVACFVHILLVPVTIQCTQIPADMLKSDHFVSTIYSQHSHLGLHLFICQFVVTT